MKSAVLTSAIVLLSASSAAFSQTSPPPARTPAASAPAKTAPAEPQAHAASAGVRQQLTANLQQAGFTNIKIVANSFFVQANDKSGNPVTIFLSPDLLTVISDAEFEQLERTGGRRVHEHSGRGRVEFASGRSRCLQ